MVRSGDFQCYEGTYEHRANRDLPLALIISPPRCYSPCDPGSLAAIEVPPVSSGLRAGARKKSSEKYALGFTLWARVTHVWM